VAAALRQEFAGTTVTIAHRLETIACCDAVLLLEEGELRAFGAPADVLPLTRQQLHAQRRAASVAE
jgi:ABC-type multidrug transport system fused ATPase/permease subunit